MASLDGALPFGDIVTCVTQDIARRAQQNTYPGLSGIEELDHGSNGRFTIITGRLVGITPFDLGSAMQFLRNFNDGLTHVLVDNEGWTWPFVKYDSFEAEAKARFAPPYGYTRRYTLRLKHLL